MLKNQLKKFLLVIFAFGLAMADLPLALAAEDMREMDHTGDGDSRPMSMQGDVAPSDARDPHANSGGYDFGPIPPPQMADVAYMGVLRVNRLERACSRENILSNYDVQAMFGRDYDQLVLIAEGETASGKVQGSRAELLWSHALAAYWNSQIGLRHDSGDAPDQQWLSLGAQGLAPYWFEVRAAAYIGQQGHTALRLGAEYELLLTQKLILQPRIEANLYGKEDELRELGSGLTDLMAGVRLRYEIRREFAPYIGLEWNGKFGRTAEHARVAGARDKVTRVVAGVRFWF